MVVQTKQILKLNLIINNAVVSTFTYDDGFVSSIPTIINLTTTRTDTRLSQVKMQNWIQIIGQINSPPDFIGVNNNLSISIDILNSTKAKLHIHSGDLDIKQDYDKTDDTFKTTISEYTNLQWRDFIMVFNTINTWLDIVDKFHQN